MNDTGWILLVLVAAAAHAGWNALVKSGSNPTVSFALVIGTGMTIGLCALPFVGDIGPNGWVYVLISSGVHCVYYAVLLAAYARGDLSHVYPIARGLGPVLVAFGSFLASESLGPVEWLGLGLVATGLFIVARHRGSGAPPDPRATFFAIATGFLIAAYTMNDALGSRASSDGISYIAWLHIGSGAPFVAFILLRRRDALKQLDRKQLARGILGGLLGCSAYGIALLATRVGKVSHVAALRETSVLFAAFLGAKMLKEKVGWPRYAAAVFVAGGLVVMHFGAR